MKFYKIIFSVITALMVMSSCANDGSLGYSVTEPDSLAVLDYLKAYKPLKSYIDTVATPNFKLGVGIAVSDFNSEAVLYRLYCSNFNNVTAGYEMKEGSVVQSDGSLDTTDVVTFLKNTEKAGMSVYGHNLVWHANQNATYLNKLIASSVTSDEKNQILTTEMERYIKGMMTACKPYVYAWDVVNEPMADYPDPSQLKTGVGQTLTSDEFFWQDYLGKDYAVKAFKFAREYGNTNDKLFINEYGLEGTSQAKLTGLINYINYIENQGATVDGIGTQMHLTVATADTTAIVEMFKKLATTGKLIKISELDIGIADGVLTSAVTDAQLQTQAKLYNFVARAYFKYVPAAQRYGITIWSPLDSPKTSSWRGGEPIGLWTLQYDRKRAYAGFADGLAGKY